MTVARIDKEALPPLAQRLCSNEGIRRLALRFSLAVLMGVLAPVSIAGAGALVYFDELKDGQIGTEFWGFPVVAIGEEPRGWISIGRRPVGVVAIGDKHAVGVLAIAPVAIGLVAIGAMGIGVVSIGAMVIGAVSIGAMALGVWSLGAISIGLVSVGALATGRLAFGALTVGWYACGDIAVGAYAWGTLACGFYRAESWPNSPAADRWRTAVGLPASREWLLFPNWRRQRPAGDRPP